MITDDEITARARRELYLSPVIGTFRAYDQPLLLERGQMQFVWGAEGRRYLDFAGQNVSVSVGHCHPVVNEAAHRQIEEMVHCTTMWMNPVAAEYAEELFARLPSGFDWVVHFVNSGAEAIDLATLLARVTTGSTDLISLQNSFHGTHFGAATLSGLDSCHQPAIAAPGILHVPAPDPYRGIHGEAIDPYLADLDATISSSTDGWVAGLVYEPIQGYGGVNPVPPAYIDAAAARVRAAGGLVIADEIQTGFGRTGDHFWGFEAAETVPDVIVLGKGIGNGFPLAAVVCHRDIAETMTEKKFFNTFGSNPVSCAAGRAVLSVIDSDGMQENSRVLGDYLRNGLETMAGTFEFIGDVRGSGLLIGIDIVTGRESKEASAGIAVRIHEALRDEGIIAGRGGAQGNVLRVVPPMCIDFEDCRTFLDAFYRVSSGISAS